MPDIHHIVHKNYSFASDRLLSNTSLDKLIDIFRSNPGHGTHMLEGRIPPQFLILPETGSIVIKSYQRGGWMARINKDRYLNTGQIRSKREFDFLIAAEKAGITVPLPVAYASVGFPFYKTWLILKEVKEHRSFVRVCLEDRKRALGFLPEISNAINRLIKHNIQHVDLHPGNILLNGDNKIYIIDFDKARYWSKSKSRLKKSYHQRWGRAVQKYKLPEEISALDL
ncbi:3-deoxy-D-manno-octulosonic acid kinase [Desulfocicer vacuolatum DSM 3385]|uniref:3-deoxy-D-manno-octulosonic acid kinase n=1 Tax=Desulfocicer vacuolatum DSM 3385 TaxID=1121400 RepID=A0A1W1ZC73_9BACT|nr:lipopolysaccharide kinase InaA family protein [Desulfocicer vacuolatum]SMC45801.1 3-deoxy-D-manno-octulosonic acid kinase [Desulfocicer vacuolatum DSM 3385]